MNSLNDYKKYTVNDLANKLMQEQVVPQLYTYPPRKAYTEKNLISPSELWEIDKKNNNVVHLYFHFPFWKYKCIFCNLFAFEVPPVVYEDYVEALLNELESYKLILNEREIATVYLGGGDPFLLDHKTMEKVICNIRDIVGQQKFEFSIEATPYSVIRYGLEALNALCDMGVNRVNIGMLPFKLVNNDVKLYYGIDKLKEAIRVLSISKVKYISIDLMLGEPFSEKQMTDIILYLINNHVNVISLFPLSFRNDSYLGKLEGINFSVSNNYFEAYDEFVPLLLDSGYKQENSYRFTKLGGNKQEDGHYNLESILGFGCGARSYSSVVDYKFEYGYDKDAIQNYINCFIKKEHCFNLYSTFYHTREELSRTYLVLNQSFIDFNQIKGSARFILEMKTILNRLCEMGLLLKTKLGYNYTKKGYKYHDLIAYLFFDPKYFKSDDTLYQILLG